LDIIEVLWEHGPSTVAEVRAALEDELAYNTVLTMLRVLEEKGHVARELEGRAHRYRPTVEREHASRSALERLTGRLFGGSASAVMLELVGRGGLDDDELRQMRDLLDEQLRKAKES
jgi:BlaI family penicillinase repressor